jgi:hypothetical protein
MSIYPIMINDTVRLKVKFIDIDPETGEQTEVSPVSVSLTIDNSAGQEVLSTTPVQLSSYEYYYDYTPTAAGEYTIRFVGVLSSGTYVTVNQQIYVSTPTSDFKPSVTLGADEVLYFAADVTPLYLDPEELLPFFPDATLIEIGELIHHYSSEVKQIYSISDDRDLDPRLNFTALEYIKAAAACELSRTYGYGGEDELSVKLGDLSITNRSLPRTGVNRGNATTWCQLAAALRKELLASKVSMKGVQPKGLPTNFVPTTGKSIDPETGLVVHLSDRDLLGPGRKNTIVDDPMPKRGLRSRD